MKNDSYEKKGVRPAESGLKRPEFVPCAKTGVVDI